MSVSALSRSRSRECMAARTPSLARRPHPDGSPPRRLDRGCPPRPRLRGHGGGRIAVLERVPSRMRRERVFRLARDLKLEEELARHDLDEAARNDIATALKAYGYSTDIGALLSIPFRRKRRRRATRFPMGLFLSSTARSSRKRPGLKCSTGLPLSWEGRGNPERPATVSSAARFAASRRICVPIGRSGPRWSKGLAMRSATGSAPKP